MVCTHPETGRQCLYLGRRRNAYIEGLALAESEALLDECGATRRARITWYNTWRVGDLVLWDNRCTMHRRDPFDASSRRIMHRTQIKGKRGQWREGRYLRDASRQRSEASSPRMSSDPDCRVRLMFLS